MDTARGFEDERIAVDEAAFTELGVDGASHADPASDDSPDEGGVGDALFDLGTDERRMHVRAYNHWVSLLNGRSVPRIGDLDPASIAEFEAHSVLIDFSAGVDDPGIAYIGRSLREECGLETSITRIVDVPGRSLLSRLTDHYLQIISNRAPIGFEAEFVSTRGRTALYRGILMPFSSGGEAIDFIYGVINWKEVVDAETQATLDAELQAAVRATPRHAATPVADTPIWADGPSGGLGADDEALDSLPGGLLGERLTMARESAAAARAADARGRSALHRALGRAYDFALACDEDAEGYAALLAAAGLAARPRSPMTPLVTLVFGPEYDRARLADYAAVLGDARRKGVPAGHLIDVLDQADGGLAALVAGDPTLPRSGKRSAAYDRGAAELRALPALAPVVMPAGADDFVVLLARASADGTLEVIERVEDPGLTDALVRKAGG